MRVAPPVQALSCGAGTWRSIQQGLYALSSFVLAYWAGSHLGVGGHVGEGNWPLSLVGLGAAGVAAALAARGLRQSPRQLAWDGARWSVGMPSGSAQSEAVLLMFDLGGWMLVRCMPIEPPAGPGWLSRWWAHWRRPQQAQSQWLALSVRDNAAVWPDLRVALHSWRPAQGEPGAASDLVPGISPGT